MFTKVDSYEVELSSDCNAACPLCTRTQLNMPLRGNKNITLADIVKTFPSAEMIDGVEFLFSGVLGDPILNPDCYEISEYLSLHGGKVIINTNGGYNNTKWWSKLALLKNVSVNFAVDGGPNTNHLYRKNVKWDTLYRNMVAFSENGGAGQCVFIEFDHNFQDFEFVENLSKELDFSFRSRINRDTSWRADTGNPASQQKNPTDKLVTVKDIKHLFKRHQEHSDIINEVSKTVRCRYLQERSLYIASDMTLWPCCHLFSYISDKPKNKPIFDGMYTPGYNDLRSRSVTEILQDPAFTEIESRWQAENPNFLGKCLTSCATGGFRSRTNPVLYNKLKNI